MFSQLLPTGFQRSSLIAALLLLFSVGAALAATPAGTVIRNQASATYLDASGVQQTVTSNLVETTIEQVAGVQLVQGETHDAIPDSTVRFTHRAQNTGNGDDRFNLSASHDSGDFVLGSVSIFADSNADGIADNNTPITESTWLAPDEYFFFVIEATVPASATNGELTNLDVTASSVFDVAQFESNSDRVMVRTGAVVEVAKSISVNSGLSPSGPYLVTIAFENIGNQPATDLALIDALPPGMSYVPNSGSWSGFNGALTDNDPHDVHTGVTASIRFCAYDVSCIGLAEADLDIDNSSENQVTAIVSTLAVGDTGQLQFSVTVDAGLTTGALINQAEFEYMANGSVTDRSLTNSASFSVLPDAGVVANGSEATSINGMNEPVSVSSAPQGGVVVFDNIIWNSGHNVDTFNIEIDFFNSTFPVGTTVRLVKSDGATPLVDTNSDGHVDTGPVLPSAFSKVIVRLELPAGVAGNNGGGGFDIAKVARSSIDSSVFDSVVDHLDEIIANQVDVTNQAASGSSGALGQGPGPESSPVTTLNLSASAFATVDVFVRHQGQIDDSYRLIASNSSTGSDLFPGWRVQFKDASTGILISATDSLVSGASQHIIAEIHAPIDLTPGTYSIYFEALSDLTGASDRKHDAVTRGALTDLQLAPSLTSSVEPGGTIVYEHVLTNTGNTPITDILLTLTDDQLSWSSVVYEDTDLDGYLSPADLPVSGVISLLVGESKDFFIKVFAPANAAVLTQNQTTLSASSALTGESTNITDISTVNDTSVAIRKEQAVDTGCDGVPDAGVDFGTENIEVAPGNNCVIYRLIATNTGSEPSFNVTIHDYTPPYTVYYPAAACSRTPCWITEPAAELTGVINAETDQLSPGDSFFLQFSVRVQ